MGKAMFFGLLLAAGAGVMSANAETRVYPNVNRFFADNSYGTLAIALGARSSGQIQRSSGYMVLDDGASVELERARSYCIVIQHYGGSPVGKSVNYSVKMFATTDAEPNKTLVDGEFESQFFVASSVDSRRMPSYCFRRLQRTAIWLVTTSDDGDWFEGEYKLTFK